MTTGIQLQLIDRYFECQKREREHQKVAATTKDPRAMQLSARLAQEYRERAAQIRKLLES